MSKIYADQLAPVTLTPVTLTHSYALLCGLHKLLLEYGCSLRGLKKPKYTKLFILFLVLFSHLVNAVESNDSATRQSLNALLTLFKTEPSNAVRRLENIVTHHPQWHRGTLELSLLQYKMGDYEKAQRNVHRVMKNAELPAAVLVNVKALAQKIALKTHQKNRPSNFSIAKKHQVSLSLGLGYEHLQYARNNRTIQRDNGYHIKKISLVSRDNVSPQMRYKNTLYFSNKQYRKNGFVINTVSNKFQAYYRFNPSLFWRGSFNYQYKKLSSDKKYENISLKTGIDTAIADGRLNLSLLLTQQKINNVNQLNKKKALGVEVSYRQSLSQKARIKFSNSWSRVTYSDDHDKTYKRHTKVLFHYDATKKLKLSATLQHVAYKDVPSTTQNPWLFHSQDVQKKVLSAVYKLDDEISLGLAIKNIKGAASGGYQQNIVESQLIWTFN